MPLRPLFTPVGDVTHGSPSPFIIIINTEPRWYWVRTCPLVVFVMPGRYSPRPSQILALRVLLTMITRYRVRDVSYPLVFNARHVPFIKIGQLTNESIVLI